ncbi:MAG: hypothetical protein WCJ30_29230 [Deltaproteobacteria bacterium]
MCARIKHGLNDMGAALKNSQAGRSRSLRELLLVVAAIVLGVIAAIGITTRAVHRTEGRAELYAR